MTSSWAGYGPSAPPSAPPPPDNKAKRANTRQLLSCTKCRERKVKCDRMKPCSACCARGHPKDCEFVVGEGNDYNQIQQSYELRKLRQENQQLKQQLQYAQQHGSEEDDHDDGRNGRRGSTSTSRATAARQRRFKTSNRIDNLYFGTPGLANIVQDFANIQLGSQSLTHTLPRGRDMYAVEDTTYPFPILEKYSTVEALLELLPPREELFACLDLFQRRAQSCSFPHTPHELPLPKREVEQFLEDGRRNAINSPDTLALLFAMLATGMQVGQYERSGGEWVEGAVEATRRESDAFISASMQALRIASFMSRPTLCAIQTLVMLGPYLTNSGRFLDAWTLFGTTIRLAHSIGLHRNPKLLDPLPSMRECTIRQTLWWWILHMDQQYSVTLGRPLGISGIGDCPTPKPLTTNPTMLRLAEFIDQFTILARQILSSNEMLNVTAVDGFTEKLISLWDTMPAALQFTETWMQESTQLPEWPLDVMSANLFVKVQSFIILLNRQRLEKTQSSTSPHSQPRSGWSSSDQAQAPRAAHRGRPLVINASVQILQAFMFFWHRQKATLICWTMGQQAFNACMILILDAWETCEFHHEFWINQAFGVFWDLHKNGVHKLADLAVQRISSGLMMLEERKHDRQQGMMSMSRRQQQQPALELDTAAMTDFAGDAVMGNTGMFLLEDAPGMQFYNTSQTANFRPLEWIMPQGSAHPSDPSRPPTPDIPSPRVPVSEITAAPFPVMSTSPPIIPVTNSPFAVGLQPRMPTSRNRMSSSSRRYPNEYPPHGGDFTPINTSQHQQTQAQQSFPLPRGPVRQSHGPSSSHSHHRSSAGQSHSSHSGTGPRSQHHSSSTSSGRLEKGAKSHRRR